MAEAGTFAAFSELQPIQQGFSDNILAAEDSMFRKQVEGNRQAELNRRRQEQWAKDLGTSLSEIKNVAVGINSLDEMNARVISDAKKQLTDAYLAIRENPDDIEARVKIKNLESLPDNLLAYQSRFVDYIDMVKNGVASGKLSPTQNQALLSGIDRTVGKNNGMFKLANDGSLVGILVDPENDGYSFMPINDVLSGVALPTPVAMADYNSAQKTIKNMYTTHTRTAPTGPFSSRTTKGLRNEDVQGIRNRVNQLWGSDVGNMSNFARSVLADGLGVDPNQMTPELFEAYKQDFGSEIINSFATSDISKDNPGARNTAIREQRLRDQQDKGGDKNSNFLRTQVVGVLAGDPLSMQNLIGTKVEERGKEDKIIDDIEMVNNRIIVGFNDGTTEEIDPQDQSKAVGQVLRLVRPGDSPDKRLKDFQSGQLLQEFTPAAGNSRSRIRTKGVVGSLKDLSRGDAVERLNAVGVEGFSPSTGFFSRSVIIGPDGQRYDMKKQGDLTRLEKYLLKENEAAVTISAAEIPERAAAAGYTTEQYTQLLTERGVEITE